jgi:tetratricopeptide (TPR) repeat protein
MSSIGETLAYQGELDHAIGMFRQALPLLNSAGEKGYYASILVMLGGVLEQQGDLDSANRMFLEALSTQEQLKLRGDAAETPAAPRQIGRRTVCLHRVGAGGARSG